MGDLLLALIAIVLTGVGAPGTIAAGPQSTVPESEPEIEVPAVPSAKPYLVRALRGWRVAHSVSISKHAPEGASEIARRGGLPPVTVASLGTNAEPRLLPEPGGGEDSV